MDNELNKQLSFIEELNIIQSKPEPPKLRYYQTESVDAGVYSLKHQKKPEVIVLPSGSGKSLVVANIAGQSNGSTIVFQPNIEILQQNYGKMKMYYPDIDSSIFSAACKQKVISKITFATIGSVYRRPDDFKHFDNIIIDECDYGLDGYNDNTMYKQFFKSIGNKKIVGTTATPFRLYSNSNGCELRMITRTRPRFWHNIIYHAQIKELAEKGWFVVPEYFSIKGFDVSKVRVNSTGSDYVDESLKAYYKEISFDNSLLDVVKRLVNHGRKSILVFTKFVDESRILVDELGDIATIVSADMKTNDRIKTVTDFRNGIVKIVSNVGVLTTGADFPELDTVVLGRPSRSLRLIYQMICRGVRPHFNKQNCYVVDVANNLERFPKIENLWLDKDKQGQWAFFDLQTGSQVTNVYF